MRKEVFLAIIAGISIGLIFSLGTWRLTKAIKKNVPQIQIKETPKSSKDLLITIEKYEDFDVLTDNLIIKGLTKPRVDIIISTEEKDYYLKSNEDGSFEKEIVLPGGASQLKIKAFDLEGNTKEVKLTLIYSSEFAKYMENEENKTKKPISYSGTITDISGSTIQLRGQNGTILQISMSDDSSYINTLKKNAEIKLSDLAIGDYIIAMGFVNGNKVLNTKRILVSSPISENKIEIEKIVITSLSKTEINDITLPKKWIGPDVKGLKEGQVIFITGKTNEDKFELRSIFTASE